MPPVNLKHLPKGLEKTSHIHFNKCTEVHEAAKVTAKDKHICILYERETKKIIDFK